MIFHFMVAQTWLRSAMKEDRLIGPALMHGDEQKMD